MEDAADFDQGIGLYTVKRGFRRLLYTAPQDIKPSRLRWVLRFLKNRRSSDGCFDLSRRTDLMNVDPKAATNYLAVGSRDQRVPIPIWVTISLCGTAFQAVVDLMR